jgi:pimeloyl-ACP methyl ester carboxylesterase
MTQADMLAAAAASPTQSSPTEATDHTVRHRTVQVNGIDVFYREAGPATGPAILLLHGYPSSSHQYRNLIPHLAKRYRVVAPDYPGFGHSAQPERGAFAYTFDNYAALIETLTEQVGPYRYALYVFDYGAPVGFRLAIKHPERCRRSSSKRQRL